MSDSLAFIDQLLRQAGDGWERDSAVYGLDFNLICPHGWTLEQDGHHVIREEDDPDRAGEKCVSPLRTMGLI